MIIIRFLTTAFLFVKYVQCSESENSLINKEKISSENYVSVPVSVVYEETNIPSNFKNTSDVKMAINRDNDTKSTINSSHNEVSNNEDSSTKPNIQSNEIKNISSSTKMIQSDIEVHIPVKIIYDALPDSHNRSDKNIENNKDRKNNIDESNDLINIDYNIMQDATNTKEKNVNNSTTINDDIQLKSNLNVPHESQDMKSAKDKTIAENITKIKNSSITISNQSLTEDNKHTQTSNQSLPEDNTQKLQEHKINETLYMNHNENPEDTTHPKNTTQASSLNRSSARQQRKQRVNSESQKNRIQNNISVDTKLKNDSSYSSEKPLYKPRKEIRQRDPVVPIVQSENYVFSHSGDFHYSYESGDGTKAFEKGQLRNIEDNTGEAVVGSFSYIGKDGKDYSISYTADENGYRPVGDHLPTPPPIPPAIARALKYLATKTTPEPVTESTKKDHVSKKE